MFYPCSPFVSSLARRRLRWFRSQDTLVHELCRSNVAKIETRQNHTFRTKADFLELPAVSGRFGDAVNEMWIGDFDEDDADHAMRKFESGRFIAAERTSWPRCVVSDGVEAPSERRHCAPEKTPDEPRVKTRKRASMEQAVIIGIDISKKSPQLFNRTERPLNASRSPARPCHAAGFWRSCPKCLRAWW